MNLTDLYQRDVQSKTEIQNLLNRIQEDVRERLRPFSGRANTVQLTAEVSQIINECIGSYAKELAGFDKDMIVRILTTPK
jgi:hypothetical protein